MIRDCVAIEGMAGRRGVIAKEEARRSRLDLAHAHRHTVSGIKARIWLKP